MTSVMMRHLAILCGLGCMLLAGSVAGQSMIFPAEEWTRERPVSQLVDGPMLAAAVDYLAEQSPSAEFVDGVVVIRNGRMIWEGTGSRERRRVWSITKSFTSTALGLLVDDGAISLDAPVSDFLANLSDDYADLTIRHLATMTSGYRAAGETPPFNLTDTPLIPNTPRFAPGSAFRYSNDGPMELMSYALTTTAQQSLQGILQTRIATPIGFSTASRERWQWLNVSSPSQINGVALDRGSLGIEITALDLARFGHLFLNRGRWNDEQLISESWVAEATAPQVPATLPLSSTTDFPDGGGPGVYGYNWWVNGIGSGGNRLYPGTPDQAYSALGFNGNRLFVIPEWNLVIARTSPSVDEANLSMDTWGEFLRRIGQAIHTESDADFNNDGILNLADVDQLMRAIRTGSDDTRFDLFADGALDTSDLTHWVAEAMQTYFGDANLDGEFNSSDLVAVFEAGQYEDLVEHNSTWASGDWDADGDFTSSDLVAAFQDGGYEQGPRMTIRTVPEPSTPSMLAVVFVALFRRRSQRQVQSIRDSHLDSHDFEQCIRQSSRAESQRYSALFPVSGARYA